MKKSGNMVAGYGLSTIVTRKEQDNESGETISIVDKLLLDQEFDLDDESDELLIRVTTDEKFKSARKRRTDWLRQLKNLPICKEMESIWDELARNGNSGVDEMVANAGDLAGTKERVKKRRKTLKGLKKWTGIAEEGERKFKGWSDNGHKAFEQWTTSIKSDVSMGRYNRWERAYREAQKNNKGASETEDAADRRFIVDRSVVWEL